MRKNILLINWGTKDKEYPFIVAQKKGLNVFLATDYDYPTWVLKYVSQKNIIITNTYDSERLLIDVLSFMGKYNIKFNGITTFFEMNVIQTADLAASLGLPFVSPAAARRSSNNKLLMRMRCKDYKVSYPRFAVFQNLDQGLKALREIGSPVIIKPIKSGHSFGAIYVGSRDEEEFIKLFRRARSQLDTKGDEWMEFWNYKDDYIMEEYLEGKVVSVDGLIQDNKIFIIGNSEFVMSPLPLLLQYHVYIPGHIDEQKNKECFSLAKRIIRILGFNDCGFHCELKLTKKGPVLLEIAARPPGGDMLEGYQRAYGIDFAGMYLDIAIGKKIKPFPPKIKKYVVQHGVLAAAEGVIKKVDGYNKIRQIKSITSFYSASRGTSINFTFGVPDCTFSYHLACDSMEDLKKDEDLVLSSIKVEYFSQIYYLVIKVVMTANKLMESLLSK